ncbi:MAG: hypothetical protein IJ651_07365 [Bacteroidales bacterium]|nr:hypothetical protein [Bacteroidales bacterium]
MKVAVFSFSGTYGEQGFREFVLEQPDGVEWVDCEGIEGTHCYCDSDAAQLLRKTMEGELPAIRWIDSGDYHYMSHLLASRQDEPFHLVLLDHHPDNQDPAFEGVLSCGSWVKAMREENPMVRDILTIGPEGCPDAIPAGWLEGRRGERVYVSLDKDILSRDYARTDWTQGMHTSAQVKGMLEQLAGSMQLVALDICGEISSSQGASPEDLRINKDTNIDLYKFITNYLKKN